MKTHIDHITRKYSIFIEIGEAADVSVVAVHVSVQIHEERLRHHHHPACSLPLQLTSRHHLQPLPSRLMPGPGI